MTIRILYVRAMTLAAVAGVAAALTGCGLVTSDTEARSKPHRAGDEGGRDEDVSDGEEPAGDDGDEGPARPARHEKPAPKDEASASTPPPDLAAVSHEDDETVAAADGDGGGAEEAAAAEAAESAAKEQAALTAFVAGIQGRRWSGCKGRYDVTITINGDDLSMVTTGYLEDNCRNTLGQSKTSGKIVVEKRSPDDEAAWLVTLDIRRNSYLLLAHLDHTLICGGLTLTTNVELDLTGRVCDGHPTTAVSYAALALDGTALLFGTASEKESDRPTTVKNPIRYTPR